MPSLAHASLGCCWLVDNNRTLAYRKNACATTSYKSVIHPKLCCECDNLPANWPCVQEPAAVFNSPMQDYLDAYNGVAGATAPWWVDPQFPESGDVFGIWMTDWSDFASSESVSQQQVLGGGMAFGRRQEFGRCITLTGWIESRSCAGARYMVQALQARLTNCPGESFYVLDSCPPTGDLNPDRFVLELPDARVTAPVTVIERRGGCCGDCSGTAVKVQWTFCFPRQNVWLGVEDTCTGALEPPGTCTAPCSGGCPTDPCNICNPAAEDTFDANYWAGLLAGQSTACDCPSGKYTGQIGCCDPAPTVRPPAVVSKGCWIPPQNMHIVSCQLSSKYRWHRSALSIEITAGEADLENLRIVAFQRINTDETCVTTQTEFEAAYRCRTPLFDIRVIAIKAGATLEIDSVTRQATITYPGQPPVPAWSIIDANGSGSVMNALDLGTCDSQCIYVVADCNNVSAGSTYTMSLRPFKVAGL